MKCFIEMLTLKLDSLRSAIALCVAITSLSVGIDSCCQAADEPKKITFDDHIKPIFREHCTSCHNANDKKSGLALDTYQAVMTGGSGGEIVVAGDIDSSRLYALTAHKEQPFMPPNQDMIAQAKVDLIKTWVEQGMPENSGSAIKKTMASAAALGSVSLARPEGAPPMPSSMLKQTPLHTPKPATISALAASPWSPLVAVGGQMQVALYHSESGALLGIIPFPEGEPQSITFSRDGKLILIGGGRHSVGGYAALHEIETGKRIARVGDELDIVLSADISDDNRLIALAGPQKMVRVFETLTGKLKYEQKKHTDWIYCVRFSPDGLLLATSDRSSGLVVWEADSGRLYMDLPGHKSEVRSLAWRPDSMALISGSLDGTIKIWDMNEGKQIKSWDAHAGGVAAVSVCNDGTMASTGRDNKVKIWDGAGNAAGEMPALAEAGHEIAITVDSKQVIAGDWLGNVRMWQRANPKDEKQLAPNPLPLEKALAQTETKHNDALERAKQSQEELNSKQAQHAAAEEQLKQLQSKAAEANKLIETLTSSVKTLQGQVEPLSAELNSTKTELSSQRAKRMERQSLIQTTERIRTQLSESVASLQGLKSAPAADVATIDAQIQAQTGLIDAQTKIISQWKADMANMLSLIETKEARVGELAKQIENKNLDLASDKSKLSEMVAIKAELDKKLEPLTKSMQSAAEALAASKAKADESQRETVTLASQIEGLRNDLNRFLSHQQELLAKKASVEQLIAATQSQTKPVEEKISGVQQELVVADMEVGKLEQQLEGLKALIAKEQAKKAMIQAALAEQQKALQAVQSQVQQSESELASIIQEQQLFEQAFGRKEK